MIGTRNKLEDVQQRELIREAIKIEPEVLLILKTAALYTDNRNRWHMYSELKRRFLPLIGFYAQKPALATTRHYESMIDAIDYLLPNEFDGQLLDTGEIEEL